MPRRRKWTDKKLIETVPQCRSMTEVLRVLGLKAAGGSQAHIKKAILRLDISTNHFETSAQRNARTAQNLLSKRPLIEYLVKDSCYSRSSLKRRLYKEGLKVPICEMCGQNEIWYGKKISLILDHINGTNNDNRLENLRIVCPNCNAGLDTNGGKNVQWKKVPKLKISDLDPQWKHRSRPSQRKVKNRPSLEKLLQEIEEMGFSAVGRKYGVSDNAIRKWIK